MLQAKRFALPLTATQFPFLVQGESGCGQEEEGEEEEGEETARRKGSEKNKDIS